MNGGYSFHEQNFDSTQVSRCLRDPTSSNIASYYLHDHDYRSNTHQSQSQSQYQPPPTSKKTCLRCVLKTDECNLLQDQLTTTNEQCQRLKRAVKLMMAEQQKTMLMIHRNYGSYDNFIEDCRIKTEQRDNGGVGETKQTETAEEKEQILDQHLHLRVPPIVNDKETEPTENQTTPQSNTMPAVDVHWSEVKRDKQSLMDERKQEQE
jgi:hypothetical protein